MYGCESWTVNKAECRRIDAFELWCWRRLLRVPWTARRSNQSILKEISPGCSLEGLMLKLKLHYFGHMMWRADSLKRPWCWERLKAGEGDDRGWDGWMASPTQWTWVWVDCESWKKISRHEKECSVPFSHVRLFVTPLQHTRPPCPSPTPRVHSDSRPSSWWCHPAICHPLLLLTPIPIRIFPNESTLCMR